MDRNTTIGFLLIGLLLIGYIFFNQRSEEQVMKDKANTETAVNQKNAQGDLPDSTATDTASITKAAPVQQDSAQAAVQLGVFAAAANQQSEHLLVQNNLMQIDFSSKGGRPDSIILKKFKTYDGRPLVLRGNDYDGLGLKFFTSDNKSVNTNDLQFKLAGHRMNTDSSQTIVYRLNAGDSSRYIEYAYTIHPDSYMVGFNIRMRGMNNIISPGEQHLVLQWNSLANQQEKDLTMERANSQIYYRFSDKDHTLDYFSLQKTSDKKLEKPVEWVSFKQHFFNTTFIAQKAFSNVSITSDVPDSGNVVAKTSIALSLPYEAKQEYNFPMQVFYGPDDYYILKSYNKDLESIIPLGSGLFAWVKYINKGFIIPLFHFLGRFIGSYGMIIIIMTLLIRLVLSPLTYKSYVSAAKMKVLQPELAQLKEKYKDDQQKFGMEQMKLFRTAGVSPLGGCLPTLLQLPFLYAMYSFFPSSIELRQEHFLWCKDLSTYDSIAHLPFNIPFYGDHVSLFTILMTATSIVLALYNRNLTDQSNPMMKWMPFIFPVMLLGIFNRLAAALTFYYFLSNLISITLQWVIQRFFIDNNKIHQQIQENKKKPKKKSKWQEKMESIQRTQQDVQQRKEQLKNR